MRRIIAVIIIILLIIALSAYFIIRRGRGESVLPLSAEDTILFDLSRNSGICPTSNECSVDKIQGDFAKGKMSQAYWIANRTENGWTMVISGNGIPQCSEIDPYEIPQEIYGNCIEKTGDLRFN